MIRLVATDIDGTLVKDSTPDLYEEMKEMVRTLTAKGIYFAAASGRGYFSIRQIFGDVADDIIYIAANGAVIMYKGKVMHTQEIPKDFLKGIIKECRNYKTGSTKEEIPQELRNCELSASVAGMNYLESKNKEYIDLIQYGYRNRFTVTGDLLEEERPYVKISLYRKEGVDPMVEKIFCEWGKLVKVTKAGQEWIDFMAKDVDKGNALQFVQKALGVSREETIAFGDNENDAGMMRAAGRSFAVPNAVESVKKASTDSCPGWQDKGVYRVLQGLMEQGEFSGDMET